MIFLIAKRRVRRFAPLEIFGVNIPHSEEREGEKNPCSNIELWEKRSPCERKLLHTKDRVYCLGLQVGPIKKGLRVCVTLGRGTLDES